MTLNLCLAIVIVAIENTVFSLLKQFFDIKHFVLGSAYLVCTV